CLFSLVLLLATYVALGGSERFRDYPSYGRHRTSTFLSACIFRRKLWLRPYSLTMHDVAAEKIALPRSSPRPKLADTLPDIVLIHQESVFDPRTFGLPVEPDIEAFLSPPGLAGRLHVNIFGGNSWQTE